MAFVAMFLFVALLAFGRGYFGWDDPKGDIQIALIGAFIFGIVFGLRLKN